MSALQNHLKEQAERATLLSRIMDLLNVAIDHPDRCDLVTALVEAGQEIAADLEDKLQTANLLKGCIA